MFHKEQSMRTNYSIFFCLVMITLMAAGSVWAAVPAADLPKLESPVLITSCGQSPGAMMLKVVMMRVWPGVKPAPFAIKELASLEDLKAKKESGDPYKTLIIVMGASLKGMGAAGISIENELARTDKLIAEAKSQGMSVIGAHIEGMKRRSQGASAGDTTDEQSIDAVAPLSDLLVIHKDGNADNRFSTISKENDIPLIEVDKTINLVGEFKKLFNVE
jgi:hypothetical protein